MPVLRVACLCAAWCRSCDEYRPTLEAVCAEFVAAGRAAAPRWIDIEDEADLIGDVDVETFPTLLVFDDRGVLFAGALLPHAETLRRLLQTLGTADTRPAAADPAYAALARTLTDGAV